MEGKALHQNCNASWRRSGVGASGLCHYLRVGGAALLAGQSAPPLDVVESVLDAYALSPRRFGVINVSDCKQHPPQTLAFTVPTGDSYTFASTNDPTVDATFSGGPHTMTMTAQQLRTARSTICRSPRPTTSTFRYSVPRASSLAFNAWSDATRGDWPANVPETDRRSYALNNIKHWLAVFMFRFFTISQFKRSALPNGPKISSGGSLSPRGDRRAPSDGNADVRLDELRTNIP